MTLELMIHISAGPVGLISGFFALASKKGQNVHRSAGNFFFISMAIMAVTGATLAYQASVHVTVLAGLLTFYLVCTSWLTVQKAYRDNLILKACSFLLGAAVFSYGAFLSWRAYHGVTDVLGEYSVPAAIYYFFTSIVLIATIADLIVMVRKRSAKSRMIRHIWRMCIALYIAASSFFVGQEQVFPEWLQGTPYLLVPQFSVILVMLFWITKIWLTSSVNLRKKQKNPIQ